MIVAVLLLAAAMSAGILAADRWRNRDNSAAAAVGVAITHAIEDWRRQSQEARRERDWKKREAQLRLDRWFAGMRRSIQNFFLTITVASVVALLAQWLWNWLFN